MMAINAKISIAGTLTNCHFPDASTNAGFQQYVASQKAAGNYPIGFVDEPGHESNGWVVNLIDGCPVLTDPGV